MSFIKKLLSSLFGNGKPKQPRTEYIPQPRPAVENYMDRWERERNERIRSAEEKIKDWLVASLKEKGKMEFSWESGNDEAFVTFKENNYEDGPERDNYYELEQYIIDKLDIPDAGEFAMNGSGTIYMADNLVKVTYASVLKALVDFDEENEKEVYGEEEEDSGDKVLFVA